MAKMPLELTIDIERWPLTTPFKLASRTVESIDVAVVGLKSDGVIGRGEAIGVPYFGENASKIRDQIDRIRDKLSLLPTRTELQPILAPGGARNALDCAHWDLEAKMTGVPVWERAGLASFGPLNTIITIGAASPPEMAEVAAKLPTNMLKIKLTGEAVDYERVSRIRGRVPDAWLSVDANQAFSMHTLERMLPLLIDAGVKVIEQPLPAQDDHLLDGLKCPIDLMADESAQTSVGLIELSRRYQVVNVKLDKSGGLTEALRIVRRSKELGLKVWVGNMFGTSLGMAPAFVLGQMCDFVELDGPIYLTEDRNSGLIFRSGKIECPKGLWGFAN